MRNVDDLKELAYIKAVKEGNFRQLVGDQSNSREKLPDEKGGWRFLHPDGGVWWLRRDACKPFGCKTVLPALGPMPFYGKKGDAWVRDLADVIGDKDIKGERMQNLAKQGSVSSGARCMGTGMALGMCICICTCISTCTCMCMYMCSQCTPFVHLQAAGAPVFIAAGSRFLPERSRRRRSPRCRMLTPASMRVL